MQNSKTSRSDVKDQCNIFEWNRFQYAVAKEFRMKEIQFHFHSDLCYVSHLFFVDQTTEMGTDKIVTPIPVAIHIPNIFSHT